MEFTMGPRPSNHSDDSPLGNIHEPLSDSFSYRDRGSELAHTPIREGDTVYINIGSPEHHYRVDRITFDGMRADIVDIKTGVTTNTPVANLRHIL